MSGDRDTGAQNPPYFRDALHVRRLMAFLFCAALPALLAAAWGRGFSSILLPAICLVSAVGADALVAAWRKKPLSENIWATGLLFALTLPDTLPAPLAAAGAVGAVLLGLHLFGGMGKNWVHPALLGRCALELIFPGEFEGASSFVDAAGGGVAVWLFAGGIFLLTTRVTRSPIPLGVFAGAMLFPVFEAWRQTGALAWDAAHWENVWRAPFLLGALFLATDSVTAPVTGAARLLYGLAIGALSVFLDTHTGLSEGIFFSILALSLFSPVLDRPVFWIQYRRLWLLPLFFATAAVGAEPAPVDPKAEARPFYNWIVANSSEATGLPVSHVGDPRLRDWCFTYDAAVCALAYLAMGDLTRATRILDFYAGKESVRRLGGVVNAVLHFSKEGKGIEWQVTAGPNLWLGIAAFHGYLATEESRYLELAKQQARFALDLQNLDESSPNYGGIPFGPKGVSYNPKDQRILWDETKPEFTEIYSTEANLDAWALLNLICTVTQEPNFIRGRERVFTWLKKTGYNAEQRRFNRGFYLVPDTMIAPDTHFWAVSALGARRLDEIEKGLAGRLMSFMEKTSEVTVYYKKEDQKLVPVKGYDFVDKDNDAVKERGSLVSPEWTLEAALAYSLLAQETTDAEREKFYRTRQAELLSGILAMAHREGDLASLPYATKGGVRIGHEHNTPVEGSRSAIGAAWAILALLDYDPLNAEKTQYRYSKK